MFWKVRATLRLLAISKSGMRSSRNSRRASCLPAAVVSGSNRPGRIGRGAGDAAFGRLVEAGDAVEHRGLAGAVRADQRGDVAAPGLEGQVADGDQAAEAHRQMLDLEDGSSIQALRSSVALLDEVAGDGLALLQEGGRLAVREGRAASTA